MTPYRILFEARNLLVDMGGRLAKHGFYQTRCVSGPSQEAAEEEGLRSIMEHPELVEMIENAEDDPPRLVVCEMEELDEPDPEINETGRIWFREKRWWQFWKS